MSIGLSGTNLVRFDNVRESMDDEALLAMLTATTFRGRLLGRHEEKTFPADNITWAATGNRIVVGEEMIGRSNVLRLDAKHPNPSQRSGCKRRR